MPSRDSDGGGDGAVATKSPRCFGCPAFVERYNYQRFHESLRNVTPADAGFGGAAAIIEKRERIKKHAVEDRRLQHRKLAA